jgi:hypothetical protein
VRPELATIGHNVIEAIVAVTAGMTDGSIALIGFGYATSKVTADVSINL